MANSPQAKKRAKQAETHRQRNSAQRTELRTRIKNVYKALGENDKEKATAAFSIAQPTIDHMCSKGIIHKNKAARHKSRMNAHIKALSQA